jgi:FlgD Ig-like domain
MSCSSPRRIRLLHGLVHATSLLVIGLLTMASQSHAFLVSGFVRNTQGQGIAGVDIDAENALTGEDVTLANDGTAANGRYDVFLPPGTYHLRFTPPQGQALVAQERRNVMVMSQVTLNVTLAVGFFLFGTVRTPMLQPIAGIDIDVRDQITNAELFVPHDDSDANGFYSVVLPPGTYKVHFRPNPSTSYPVRVIENVVMSLDRNLDATLQNGVRLFGTATDPAGDPLPGVSLEVFNAVTGARVWTFGSSSDQLGAYQAALVPGVQYDLVYEGPSGWGYDQVTVDSILISAPTLRNVSMPFPFRLHGQVHAAQSGAPVANVDLDVVDADGRDIPLDNDNTDGNGNYEIGVPEGLIDVIFRSPEGNWLASHIVRNLNITNDTDLNALLVAGIALSGRVRRPGGVGVANVDFDVESLQTGLEIPVFDDNTDALGDYTLVLPAGSYRLDVDPGRGVRFVAQVLSSVQVPHGGPLDILLAPGVLLSGRVIDHISNPWPGIDLDVRIANTLNEIVTPGDDTDVNGIYLVTVPPGTYDLAFNVPAGIPVVSRVFEDIVVGPGDTHFDAVLSSTVVGVAMESAPGAPKFALEPNRPNPFHPSTRIGFMVSAAGPVTLRIYDVTGRVVSELIQDRWTAAGRHELSWNGRDGRGAEAPSGVYFLRLETPAGGETRKITLAR